MKGFLQKANDNFNVPNVLSVFRILLILPLVYYFLKDNYIVSALIFILSGLSDMLDGIIARKFKKITKLGEMLDPVADKLTLAAAVICIGIKFTVVMPLVTIMIFKEVVMILAGILLLKNKKFPVAAKWYGKLATVVFYVSATIIIALKAIWGIENTTVIVTLMSITTVLTLFALVKYCLLFFNKFKAEKSIMLKTSKIKKRTENCS